MLNRRGKERVCWFCHADFAGSPCPSCGWSPVRYTVFRDQAGKRFTNEVGADYGDPWMWATICMPGGGRNADLPLEVAVPSCR